MEERKTIPLSIRRKSSSRLAAVQCMYRLRVNKENITPTELFDDYMLQWHEDRESVNRAMSFEAEPDKKLLLTLLTGIMEQQEEIEQVIRASLSDKWAFERISKLIIAVLTCAVYEIKFALKLPAAIIINEYVGLTSRFFEEGEVGFVNGLLDRLKKEAEK